MVLQSIIKELQIPAEAQNLPYFVCQRLTSHGNKIAVIEAQRNNRKITYLELLENINRSANSLWKRGVRQGDVITVFLPNCVEYFYLFYSAAILGAVLHSANPSLTARELTEQMNECGSKWLIVSYDSIDSGLKSAKQCNIQHINVFLIDCFLISSKDVIKQNETDAINLGASLVTFQEILENGENVDLCNCDYSLDKVVVILYSSGTTGKGKGVKVTQRCHVHNTLGLSHPEFTIFNQGDINLMFLPMYHAYCQIMILSNSIWMGVTNIIMSKFNLEEYFSLIQKYRVNVSLIVPPVAVMLAKSPLVDKYDLSSLRLLVSAAATLSEAVEKQIEDRIGVGKITQLYGMTEVGVVLSHQKSSRKLGSVGSVFPGCKMKVVSLESGKEVGCNEQGEMLVKGPGVTPGYLNLDQGFTKDGWFITGDLVYYDEDFNFYIADRVKDIIKYKAMQVAPAELEAILLKHPAVEEAAVIGKPDDLAGELPRACVVIKAGAQVTEDEIQQHVDERVAPFKRLRGGVVFVDEIPKSAAGKVLRRTLSNLMEVYDKEKSIKAKL